MLTKYFSPQTKTKNDIVVERIVVVVVVVIGLIDSNQFGIKETISIFCEERLCVYVVGCFNRKSVSLLKLKQKIQFRT